MTPNADFAHDTQRLDGQVALVTGASRGLGRAFARTLAAAGAAVAVAARSADGVRETARQIQELGGRAAAYALDVTDPAAVEQVVAAIGRELGPIDLLVNNAGVMAPVGPDWLADRAAWWQTFEINVLGSFLCAQAVLPTMIARGQGRIINISSPAVNWASGYASAYHASKAALTSWSENLAQTTQAHGISAFAYAPGFVRSDMTEYLAYSPAVKQWFGDLFQKIFDEGNDTPLELTLAVFMLLASGQADALSGRHIADTDVPAQLLRNLEQVRQIVYTCSVSTACRAVSNKRMLRGLRGAEPDRCRIPVPNGKPFFVNGLHDNVDRILAQLPRIFSHQRQIQRHGRPFVVAHVTWICFSCHTLSLFMFSTKSA